ncbi:unnamed protein product [Urochloa humidicola]
MLVKSYKNENNLSGGTTCKWYINEEIPEIETYFDRVYDHHEKVEWVSSGDQQYKSHEHHKNLEEKTVMQLRDIDPWEFEVPSFTGIAEFVLFGKFARQIIGKPVVALIRSANKNQPGSATDPDHILPEIAALVSQKFTFSVSVTQKSLTQRNVSFQVNGIVAVYGKQPCIPRCIDASPTSSTHADSTTIPHCPLQIDDSDATPPKKARLDRMITIENKKQLDLKNNKSGEGAEHTSLSAQTANQTQHSNPVVQSGEIFSAEQSNATCMSECPSEKISPSTSDAGKQKHVGTGKKSLASK